MQEDLNTFFMCRKKETSCRVFLFITDYVKIIMISYMQAWSKPILIGQAILNMSSRGVWGHAPPENFKKLHIVRCNLVHSGGCPIKLYFKIHNHKFCTIYLKVPKICSLCSEFPTNSFAISCSLTESVMSLYA